MAAHAGLRKGDQIIQVEDSMGNVFPIKSLNDFSKAIRTVRNQNTWAFHVVRKGAGGQEETIRLPVKRMELTGWNWKESLLTILWISLMPLVATATAFFIGFSKPEDDHAFIACLLFLSLSAIITITIYLLPPWIREFNRIYETTCNAFLPYFFLRFFLWFPSPSWIDRKLPSLKTVFLVFTGFLWLVNMTASHALYTSFDLYERVQNIIQPFRSILNFGWFSMFFIGLVSLLMNTFRKQSSDEKRRMIILLTGVAAGLVVPAFLIVVLLQTGSNSIGIISAIAICLAAFPASFAYVVIRHRVLGIDLIIRRGLQYLLISRGFWILESIVTFALLYLLLRPLLIRFLPVTPPLVLTTLIGGIALALYFVIRKVNQPIMRAIDRRFFRTEYDAREILTELSRAVGRLAASPAELLQLVTEKITRSLYPNHAAVFLRGYDISHDTEDKPRLHPMKTDQYFCVWIQKPSVDASAQLSPHAFPEDAVVPRQVESLREPEALDIYMDDPQSWVHALAQPNEKEPNRIHERELLRELDTRLVLPLQAGGRSIGLLSLGDKLSEEPYSREDKNLLLTVAQQTAIALDYSKLIAQEAEQEKLKREMEIARQVQAQLFPQTLPIVPELDFTGFCKAARGVGGDYYDFLKLGDGLLGIALGDISGKGISAALLMAGLQALLRSNAPAHQKDLDHLFPTINRLMCSSTARGKYATFFYAVYDERQQCLHYVNAGHLPPMLFRSSGEVIRLKTGGMVLGMFPDATYQKDQVQMQKGDVLLIYTDGVSEAMNVREEEFGEERLMELVRPNLGKRATEISDVILAGVEEFVQTAPQHDDITLVIVRRLK